ncbi:MAG: ankyrin repeat domain-containing protein [bacterium]|nr:ankyrin repeat domain-containing protein [bacterium]
MNVQFFSIHALSVLILLQAAPIFAEDLKHLGPDAPECRDDFSAHGDSMRRQDPCLPLLHFAALFSELEMAKDALANGADPNAVVKKNYIVRWGGPTGMTPLFFASDPDMAKLLIQKGADVNFVVDRSSEGRSFSISVLQAAFQRFPVETIQVLIDAGAKAEQTRASTYLAWVMGFIAFDPDATKKLELLLSLDLIYDPVDLRKRNDSENKSNQALHAECEKIIAAYAERIARKGETKAAE